MLKVLDPFGAFIMTTSPAARDRVLRGLTIATVALSAGTTLAVAAVTETAARTASGLIAVPAPAKAPQTRTSPPAVAKTSAPGTARVARPKATVSRPTPPKPARVQPVVPSAGS
jgi:hypothetical protein